MIARDIGLLILLGAMLPAFWFETFGWRDLADAPQTVYRAGVPHTERTGAPRSTFDVDRSFFPIGLYHAMSGQHHGRNYDLAEVAAAGFNTVHFWERQNLSDIADAARDAGVQIVYHNPRDDDVRRFRNHPALLSWYLDEEPTLHFSAEQQARLQNEFFARRRTLRQIDPGRPVHIVGSPPGNFTDWDAWTRIGDIAVFSVYPARGSGFALAGLRSLADSVSRAVGLNDENKPVWVIVQAFASPRYGWRMPTADEYRAMVYTAIVHGATGLITFAFDSFATRDGQVLGITPHPLADYGDVPDYDGRGDAPLVVGETELAQSAALWRNVARINHEIAELTPALLSPTAMVPYRVSVLGLNSLTTPVRTLLKRENDSYLLIAVNVSDRGHDTRFSFNHSVIGLRRPFSAVAPMVSDNGWSDRLEAFQVRVYRFSLGEVPSDEAQPFS